MIDSQKSPKTPRKLQKMRQLQASKVDQMFCNTRYIYTIVLRCCKTVELFTIPDASSVSNWAKIDLIKLCLSKVFILVS